MRHTRRALSEASDPPCIGSLRKAVNSLTGRIPAIRVDTSLFRLVTDYGIDSLDSHEEVGEAARVDGQLASKGRNSNAARAGPCEFADRLIQIVRGARIRATLLHFQIERGIPRSIAIVSMRAALASESVENGCVLRRPTTSDVRRHRSPLRHNDCRCRAQTRRSPGRRGCDSECLKPRQQAPSVDAQDGFPMRPTPTAARPTASRTNQYPTHSANRQTTQARRTASPPVGRGPQPVHRVQRKYTRSQTASSSIAQSQICDTRVHARAC